MPKQKPGRSNQSWQTPPDFIASVETRLQGQFWRDLAATNDNHIPEVSQWFTPEQDAFKQDWSGRDYYETWQWLNPPYGDLRPWVEKCAIDSKRGGYIACLVPASVGANWWRDWVAPHAYVLFLNGRLTFVGAGAPYPKDLALLLYTPFIRSGSAVWNWRVDASRR